ncbi:hypothetical protein HY041_02760 [Candidatus Roizmanbacteria bacterium]|nr:hypothetical protein [Candidatus Roizmanbacteria bacterium]
MNLNSKQVYQRQTKLVRIDAELCRMLKIKAATEGTTIRALIESTLAELLAVDEKQNS